MTLFTFEETLGVRDIRISRGKKEAMSNFFLNVQLDKLTVLVLRLVKLFDTRARPDLRL